MHALTTCLYFLIHPKLTNDMDVLTPDALYLRIH